MKQGTVILVIILTLFLTCWTDTVTSWSCTTTTSVSPNSIQQRQRRQQRVLQRGEGRSGRYSLTSLSSPSTTTCRSISPRYFHKGNFGNHQRLIYSMTLQHRSQRSKQEQHFLLKATTSATAQEEGERNDKVNDTDDDKGATRRKENQQQQLERQRRLSVGAILASSFLNLLGFTMASPITPALGKHFALNMGASFGSLTSAYPLGMLLGLLVWPRLSDTIGRKTVIMTSLLGSGLGLMGQTWVIQKELSLGWFLFTRALTGTFAGSSPVSKAYLADVGSKNGKLPRYLALRDASATMAYIVGPMLGGLLFEFRRWLLTKYSSGGSPFATAVGGGTTGSLSFVIGISAAASLAAALLVASLVTDIKPPKKKTKQGADLKKNSDYNINSDSEEEEVEKEEELIACPLGKTMWAGVASVCVVSFLFNVGDSCFHAFYSQLQKGAGMSAGDIGFLYTILATISFSVSTTTTGWMMRVWGPVWTCAMGLMCVGTGLSALGIASWGQLSFFHPNVSILATAAAVYYCGVPLYGPTIPTMLLRCVPSNQRGTIMGLDGTINTIARIVSPLIMGDIFRRYGAGAAFGLAGIMVFGGVFTTLIRRYVVLRKSYSN